LAKVFLLSFNYGQNDKCISQKEGFDFLVSSQIPTQFLSKKLSDFFLGVWFVGKKDNS